MRRIMITAGIFVALAATACGGGDGGPEVKASDTFVERSSTTTEVDPDAGAKEFVDALAGYTVADMEQALAMTAEGSDAQAYVRHQIAMVRLRKANGVPEAGRDDVSVEGDALKTCNEYEGEETCYTWSDFVADPSGLISTFSVNNKPITGRVVRASGPVEFDGATYQIEGGLQDSLEGDLLLVVSLRPGETPAHFPYSAAFVGDDGIQIQFTVENSGFPTDDIAAGATSYGLYSFSTSAPPGRLIFDNVCTSNYSTCESVTLGVG